MKFILMRTCQLVQQPYNRDAITLFILPDGGKMNQVKDALLKETLSK